MMILLVVMFISHRWTAAWRRSTLALARLALARSDGVEPHDHSLARRREIDAVARSIFPLHDAILRLCSATV